MKKLVLLGDSIRLIGYGTRLAEIMSDEYEVWITAHFLNAAARFEEMGVQP